MKRFLLTLTALWLLGCDGDEQVTPHDDRTVHLAGFLVNSNMDGDNVASYWKDSVYTKLTAAGIPSKTSSLHIDGSSVLIGGSKRIGNSLPVSVMWRDGVETVIDGAFGLPMVASRNNNLFGVWLTINDWVFHKNGSTQPILDTAYSFAPMAMALKGDDVYISGYSSGPPLPPTYSPPQHAQYWKNGLLIFSEPETSNGLAIFTRNDDVYMAGHTYDPDGTSIACYWKNGERFDLTDGEDVAIAKSVFVTDEQVYVAGMKDDQAVYWKDGVVNLLTTEGTYSMANAIYVAEGDVYAGGYQNGHPALWRNGVRQEISNQDKPGQVLFVVVVSN